MGMLFLGPGMTDERIVQFLASEGVLTLPTNALKRQMSKAAKQGPEDIKNAAFETRLEAARRARLAQRLLQDEMKDLREKNPTSATSSRKDPAAPNEAAQPTASS